MANLISTSISGTLSVSGNGSFFAGGTSQLSIEDQGTFTRFAFNKLTFYDWNNGYDVMTIDGGYVSTATSFRAPIFYDSEDTGYYVDPNSTSRQYRINFDYLYYAPDTNYGFAATSVYADTVNSGYDSDPLELVYVKGSGVNIGTSGGNKPLRSGYLRSNGNWASGDFGAEQFTIRGTSPSITFRDTNHDSKWLMHIDSGNVNFYYGGGVDNNSWERKFFIPTDGNIWMSWAGDYLSNLLAAKSNVGHTHDDRYYTESESDARFQPLENQRLSTSNNVTFNQVYTNNWFRNNNINTGLYQEAGGGNHWYAEDSNIWTIGANGSYPQIRFRSGGHQGTIRGYVYADTSNNIGFLNNSGSWSLRTDSSRNTVLFGNLTVGQDVGYSSIYMYDSDEGIREIHCNSNRIGFLTQAGSWGAYADDSANWFSTGYIQSFTSMYSPIYYDGNDSNYYLDPSSTTALRTVGSWRADSAAWDGEFAGKIQYHANNWYFQASSYWYFRNSGGSNVVSIDSGGNISSNGYIGSNTSQTRDKLRVWDSGSYSIGMKNGYDYGHLGNDEYAMSFQMNDNSGRGFWWGDDAHNDNQGAASLTTDGRMTIARTLSVGEGESVVSPSSTPLYVKGSTSGADVVGVDGVNGRLFTVTDDLSGSLFSVNTIAGLPVIEAFADNTVTIGKYGYATTWSTSGFVTMPNSANIYRDLFINGGTGGDFGNRLIIGTDTATYTLQDTNKRPTAYLHGAYPVLTLNHTVTSNGDHGPTVQFTHDTNNKQWVIGTNGTGTRLDIGYSENTDRNPHNGIADYNGSTFLRVDNGGNIQLGRGNGRTTWVNDTLYVGANDSGDSHMYFGEDSSGWYGLHWYWDSGYTVYLYGRNAGTDTEIMRYTTNSNSYVEWRRHFNMNNYDINYLSQIHFNDDVRFYDDGNNHYLNFKWGNGGAGGIKFVDGDGSLQGYVYGSGGGSFGLLDGSGNWKVRVDTGSVEMYGDQYLTNVYAYILYDRSDNSYYLDPASYSRIWRTSTHWAPSPGVGSSNWVNDFNATPVSSMSFGGDLSSGGPQGTWWFQQNMRHSNTSNYWGTQIAWGWEDNANELWQRNVTGGSWSSWVRYINTNNYTGILDGRYQQSSTAITTGNIGSQSVSYANYAGYLPTAYIGGQQTNPQTYFGNSIGVKVAMTGSWSVWSDTLWINGYSGGDVKSMNALHFLRNGEPRFAISTQNHDATSYGTYYEVITAYNIASQSVNYATSAGALTSMNISQFTNNSGYLTAEADTLATVTARGNSTSGNLNVFGDILLTGDPTTTNQNRRILFNGFDKEGTTDFSDSAYIQHTINSGGHSGSVLVISSQNDANDGIAFETNASSQIRHNGHVMWDAGNDGSGSGLDADLLDGQEGSYYQPASTAITTGNIGSQSVNYASSAGSAPANGGTSTYSTYLNPLSGDNNYKLAYTADGARNNAGEWGRAVMYYIPNGQTYGIRVDRADYCESAGTASSASSATTATTANRLERYGIIYGDDWNSYNQNNRLLAISSHNHTGANRPAGAYTYGSGLSYYNSGSDHYQFFFPENGGSSNANSYKIWYRSGWNNNWGGWRSLVDLYNGACAIDGTVTATGDIIAYSDARVKENVQTIENALDKTLKLRGVTYNRTDVDDKSTKIGVIAQEIMEVFPEVVNEDENGMYGVSYGNLTAVLIEAIKEQQKQIEELKLEVQKLKSI